MGFPFTTAGNVNTIINDNVYNDGPLKKAIDEKQHKLTAGTNITISEDYVISATGGGTALAAENITIPDVLLTDTTISLSSTGYDLITNGFTNFSEDFKTKIIYVLQNVTEETSIETILTNLKEQKIIESPDPTMGFNSIIHVNGCNHFSIHSRSTKEIALGVNTLSESKSYSYYTVIRFYYEETESTLKCVLFWHAQWGNNLAPRLINDTNCDAYLNNNDDFKITIPETGVDSFTISEIKIDNILAWSEFFKFTSSSSFRLNLSDSSAEKILYATLSPNKLNLVYYNDNFALLCDEYSCEIGTFGGDPGEGYLMPLENITLTKVSSYKSVEDASITPDRLLGKTTYVDDILTSDTKSFKFNTAIPPATVVSIISSISASEDIYIYSDNATFISATNSLMCTAGHNGTIMAIVGGEEIYVMSRGAWGSGVQTEFTFTADNMTPESNDSINLYEALVDANILVVDKNTYYSYVTPIDTVKGIDHAASTETFTEALSCNTYMSDYLDGNCKSFYLNTSLSTTEVNQAIDDLLNNWVGMTGFVYASNEGTLILGKESGNYSITLSGTLIYDSTDGGWTTFTNPIVFTETNQVWASYPHAMTKYLYSLFFWTGLFIKSNIKWGKVSGVPSEETTDYGYSLQTLAKVNTVALEASQAKTYSFDHSEAKYIDVDMMKYMAGKHYLYCYNSSTVHGQLYNTEEILIVTTYNSSGQTLSGTIQHRVNCDTSTDLASISYDYDTYKYKITWNQAVSEEGFNLTFNNCSNMLTPSDDIIYKYFIKIGALKSGTNSVKWAPASYSKEEIDNRTRPLMVYRNSSNANLLPWEYVYGWFGGQSVIYVDETTSGTTKTAHTYRISDLYIDCETPDSSTGLCRASVIAYYIEKSDTLNWVAASLGYVYYQADTKVDVLIDTVDVTRPLKVSS